MSAKISRNGHAVQLTAHKAIYSGHHHGNTTGAVRECLERGVSRLELDVHSLEGPDYAVFHERRLETETTGSGSIGRATADDIRDARYLHDPDDRPPLLSEVIELACGSSTELQLDLKDWRPMAEERVRSLLAVVEPVHDQVIISTGQDWNLRRFHRADPELALGFDPGHYFDHAIEGADVFLPRSMGAYQYRDDHPMAFGKTEAVTDYLEERWTLLHLQAPWAREFFLSYLLILQMLNDGFNICDWLHERGIAATAWTPDCTSNRSVGVLDRLMDAGVDRITTNTIPAWMEAIGC